MLRRPTGSSACLRHMGKERRARAVECDANDEAQRWVWQSATGTFRTATDATVCLDLFQADAVLSGEGSTITDSPPRAILPPLSLSSCPPYLPQGGGSAAGAQATLRRRSATYLPSTAAAPWAAGLASHMPRMSASHSTATWDGERPSLYNCRPRSPDPSFAPALLTTRPRAQVLRLLPPLGLCARGHPRHAASAPTAGRHRLPALRRQPPGAADGGMQRLRAQAAVVV